MEKKIFIYSNKTETTRKIKGNLIRRLNELEIVPETELTAETDVIICIGGDGTLLEFIHEFNFPNTPIIGVNTGHLGFFQYVRPDRIDRFLEYYLMSTDRHQVMSTVSGRIHTKDGVETIIGLNEIVVKGGIGCNVHLNISIGDSFIERFSGDGILVATPAGSTAYNYSLGGSIVDPRLDLLQVTPIAPMNTTAYRSFTSSILLPSDLCLEIYPDMKYDPRITIQSDGFVYNYENVDRITIGYSDHKVRLVKFSDYDFWKKVKEKFL